MKAFVCRCEDITLHELRGAVERGYTDMESLKRYTGLATGPCQGKGCLPLCMRLLAEMTGQRVQEVALTRLRPPVVPVPLGLLAEWGRQLKRRNGEAWE